MMTQNFNDFVDYFSPALTQVGMAIVMFSFFLFCAIIAITLIIWGYNRIKLGKYGR